MHHVLHASVLQILRYLLKSIINRKTNKKTLHTPPKKQQKNQPPPPTSHTLRVILNNNHYMCQMQNVSSTELFSVERIVDYCLHEMYSIREVNAWKSWKANTWRFQFLALTEKILIFHLRCSRPKLFSEVRGEFSNAELHSDSPASSTHPCSSDQGMISQCFRFTLFYGILPIFSIFYIEQVIKING